MLCHSVVMAKASHLFMGLCVRVLPNLSHIVHIPNEPSTISASFGESSDIYEAQNPSRFNFFFSFANLTVDLLTGTAKCIGFVCFLPLVSVCKTFFLVSREATVHFLYSYSIIVITVNITIQLQYSGKLA